MMLLIAMAITVAFGASLATEAGAFDQEFWWELAALIVVMLLGHWQEMRALGQARSALDALAALLPDEAERVTDSGTETVTVAELAVGDVVLVRPGSRVPADGKVVDGQAEVDESMITGESRPVPKAEGDSVAAGTVATDDAIRVEITAVGDETTLAGIQRLVADAEQSHSRTQALADRAAALLFYVAVTAAVVTFVVWAVILGDTEDAINRTVTVLVISCPHALGLAIPLVIALSTALAARQGLLVRNRLALEAMREVDVVLFDKTGTLTAGRHGVADAIAFDGDTDAMLALAAAVEADSQHPLARAIVDEANGRSVEIRTASEFRSRTGRGVEATIDGTRYSVSGPRVVAEENLTVPDEVTEFAEKWSGRGAAVLYLATPDDVVGAIALEDTVRGESADTIARLHERGIRVGMITGDAQAVADAVATELDIDDVFAEVLPEDKDSKVAELQAQGLRVAMVGDGVNDAPALARADIGIAIGAGTDVAIESADLVLASDDPRGVLDAIGLSKASYAKMVQNLGWAAGYNIAAIPLAAGVAAPVGFVLPPAIGAVLMSLSTIVVAANAQLLRRSAPQGQDR